MGQKALLGLTVAMVSVYKKVVAINLIIRRMRLIA